MKFSIPWESPKWWRLGCQTSNGAQGHLGKLIPSFTVQVTWPQLGGERFRAWERDLMFESMPGWMPLPWLPSCWRVEAGLNLYSRPLKGNQNGFFVEKDLKNWRRRLLTGGWWVVYVRWILFDGSFEIRPENHHLRCIKSLIKNGISTTFPSTGEPVNPGFLVATNSRLTIAIIVCIVGGFWDTTSSKKEWAVIRLFFRAMLWIYDRVDPWKWALQKRE